MTVRDKKGNIADHTADALLYAGEKDYSVDQLKALIERYPEVGVLHHEFAEKAKPGQMKPVDIEGGKVILLALRSGSVYIDIRQAFEKLVKNSKRLKVNSVACAPIGQGLSDKVHPDAIELIAKGIVADAAMAIDVYSEHVE